MLGEFTGNEQEAVLTVHTKEQLKTLIRFISVTASRVASKSSSVGKDAPETKQQEALEIIKEGINNDPILDGVDIGVDAASNSSDDQWDDNTKWE